jgi:small-conductance mechanosensitive channel
MGKIGWGAIIVALVVSSAMFLWYMAKFLFYLAQIIFTLLVFLVRLFIAFLVLLKDWTNEYLERRRAATRAAARSSHGARTARMVKRSRTATTALRPKLPNRPRLRRRDG